MHVLGFGIMCMQLYFLFISGDGLLWARRCTDVLYNNSVEPLLEMTENEVVKMFQNSSLIEVYFEPGTTIMDACMKAKCFDREGMQSDDLFHSVYGYFF